MLSSHCITALDVHVAGEPLRVITGGFPELPGRTILEKRRACRERYDHLRRAVIFEPRGHNDMYGCLIVPSETPAADVGAVFFHNDGYSTMCGHGIIGLVSVLREHGLVSEKGSSATVRIETPSGLVQAKAVIRDGRVRSVAFRNVPSFVVALDETVDVPGVGRVRYDLAFGGAFYAFCRAEDVGAELKPEHASALKQLGMEIKTAIARSRQIVHPEEPELGFLYGTIFWGMPERAEAQCRHVCIFADGALDRSPTGTGVSAHLAIRAARGIQSMDEPWVCESILGTTFTGRMVQALDYHNRPAIIPEIEGRAFLTGQHEFVLDPEDPLCEGFRLR